MEYVITQLGSFFMTFVTGMILGVFFDLYRIWRSRNAKGRSGRTDLADFCFWIGVFILVTPLIYWSTWLELRFYVGLALVTGTGLYFWAFSPMLLPVLVKFWRFVTWIPHNLCRWPAEILINLRMGRSRRKS